MLYAVIRRTIFLSFTRRFSATDCLTSSLCRPLFYLPFFVLGAQTFINPRLKAMFTTSSPRCFVGALLGFIAYRLNQQYGSGDGWMYETESVITMVLGLWMVNVVFSLGHRLLNFQSARVTYFVNASLFIYPVHHPLTLLYGAWITPIIKSNLLGFYRRTGVCGGHCAGAVRNPSTYSSAALPCSQANRSKKTGESAGVG